MAEARLAHDWSIAAEILCVLYNAHRPAKVKKPYEPRDFNPMAQASGHGARKQQAKPMTDEDRQMLREVFSR